MSATSPAPVAVSGIVVNHSRRDLLEPCLDSLTSALETLDERTELVVVDNGSDDGSPEMVTERHPDVKLVLLPENRGFATAVNEGLRASTGEWVLLLNNDATLERSAAARLLDAGRTSPSVGAVACQLRFAGSGVINSAGIEVDRLGVAYDRLLGERAAEDDGRPVEVFGASGGASLLRRAMLEDTGGLDGSLFAYLEDADLAWRAHMRGWRSLYVPAAVAHHRYSATSEHGSAFKYFHAGLNRVRLLAKNAERRQLLRYGPAIVAYDLAYVAGVAVRDRTLAPARGRIRGLREWRAYRRAGASRRPVALAPPRGIRGGLARRSVWARHGTVNDRPSG